MSLNLTRQRIISAKGRVDKYIDQNIMTWATEEILLPGHTDIQKSVSSKAAEGLKIEKTGFMKIDLLWEYYIDDKPVHLYLEHGTRPHIIRPKGKDNGGSDVLHWKGPSGGFVIGQDHFAREVRHPGTQPKKLIEGIKDERLPRLQERVIREVNNFMEIDAL